MINIVGKILQAIAGIQETVNKINDKIDNNSSRLDALHKDIHDPIHGIEQRLQCLCDESNHTGEIISQLQKQNNVFCHEMSVMKGYITKLEQKVISQQNQITDVVGRGMRENLIINGFREEEGENLKERFSEFILKKLEITDERIIIDRIHRFGQRNKSYPRPIVAKFHSYNQKERVLEKSKIVKSNIEPVRISPHFPDEIREKKIQLYELKKQYDKENITTKIKGDKLLFPASGNIFREKVPIPKASEVLNADGNKFEFKNYSESNAINDRGNEFIGRATTVSTYGETREAVRQILRKPDTITATHNSYAYSFTDTHGKTHQGYDDDGEHGAGSKLLKHLRDNKFDNVLVVVSRYAGDKIGPQRFTHLINAGNAAVGSL